MKMREREAIPARGHFRLSGSPVTRELEVLEDTLDTMIDMLKPGGRLCIITFHSLEDRIVKNAFRRNEKPCICRRSFPSVYAGAFQKAE